MSRPATTPLHGYETFAKADTSVAKQEELKAKLFEAAREEKRHTLFGSKKPEKRSPASVEKLKVLFRSLLENNLYPALIELYDRYRDDPEKADEFKKINNIIKDPVMEDFHAQLIPKGWKRHRVKDQPDNTPDGRHPFNIFAGIYYHKSTRLRSGFIAQYTTMRTTVALGVAALNENESDKAIAYFKEAVEQFTKALQYFIPIIEEDHCYKLRLEDELKKLEQIQDWKDPTQWQQATTSFEQIKADAENVLKRCYKIFELGMKHGDFICYSEANATDRGQLEILRYEDRIRNPNVTSADELRASMSEEALVIIQRLMERNERFRTLHIYPSYVIASFSGLYIGLAYARLVEALVHTISDEMKLKLANPYCHASDVNELTIEEQSLRDAIFCYQQIAGSFFGNAVNYASAAAQLKETGLYDDIAANLSSVRHIYTTLQGIEHGEDIAGFAKHMENHINELWQKLNAQTRKALNQTQQPVSDLVPARSEIDRMLADHKRPPELMVQLSV